MGAAVIIPAEYRFSDRNSDAGLIDAADRGITAFDKTPVLNTAEMTGGEDEVIMLLSNDEITNFSPVHEDTLQTDEEVLSVKAQDVAQMLEDNLPEYEYSSRLEAAQAAAEEETSDYDYSSKIEEVSKKIEDATRPKDVPHKLTYAFNQKMVIYPDADEVTVLQRIVEAEAGDQDIYGRILVANVILNRVNNKAFPDSISKVVFQKIGNSTQFSPVRDGSYYNVTVSEKTVEAVSRALVGEDYSEGALYFFMRSGTSAQKAAWFDRDLKFLFKYGCHEFFKEK
ncbi:MAG: cell wall hydrolase [Lachnospiraceae bacterium]|nr:cell wall hydrolase [Lachnospiraceae bacterium]